MLCGIGVLKGALMLVVLLGGGCSRCNLEFLGMNIL